MEKHPAIPYLGVPTTHPCSPPSVMTPKSECTVFSPLLQEKLPANVEQLGGYRPWRRKDAQSPSTPSKRPLATSHHSINFQASVRRKGRLDNAIRNDRSIKSNIMASSSAVVSRSTRRRKRSIWWNGSGICLEYGSGAPSSHNITS